MKLSTGFGVALLTITLLWGVGACHHSTSGAQGDGGDDGADDSFCGDDAFCADDGDLDAPAPSTCPELQQWAQTCTGAGDPCATYLVSHCMAYDQYLSDGARQAIDDCYGYEQTCCTSSGDDASGCGYDVGTCMEQELIAVDPTAAQQKLAADYCALCGAGDPSCAGNFYLSDEAVAPGAVFLMMNDALVGQIDAKCTTPRSSDAGGGGDAADAADAGGITDAGAPASCAATFDSCAAAIYEPTLPSLACPGSDAGP